MIRWVVRHGDGATLGDVLARAGADGDALADGRVFVDRRRMSSAGDPVAVGASVTISPKREPAGSPRILAQVQDLIAVDKPAGMPTIADHGGAAHTLLAMVARATGLAATRLHATSRLDRGVSGVVVFACSARAIARLKEARERGTYERRYVAIASHAPSPAEGLWDAPIGRAKDPRHRTVSGRDATHAESRFLTIARASSCALLALAPLTGRTHQLRVHASHAGAPLLGDVTYGGPNRIVLPRGRVLGIARIALHAARVSVPGPGGDALVVEAPVPDDLRSLWEALGGKDDWARGCDY